MAALLRAFLLLLACAGAVDASPLIGSARTGSSTTAAPITPGSAAHKWRHLAPTDLDDGVPNVPMWSAIYDFDYETDEGGKRNKLMFIVWAPDDAPIKEKMLYASSKDGLKKKIVGIQWEVQGTDYEEVEFAEIVNKFAK